MLLTAPIEHPAASTVPSPQRPPSASAALTGLAGVVAFLVVLVLLRDWLQPTWLKALAVLAIAGAAMLAVDLVVYRTHASPTTGLSRSPLRALDLPRIGRKLLGFWATLAVLAAAYTILPVYAEPLYQPFREAALWCLPMLAVTAPVYIAHVDRHQHDPDDAYARLGAMLLGRAPWELRPLVPHALGWLVKGFFLPLMFSFACNGMAKFWAETLPAAWDFGLVFERTIDLLYLIDVALAVAAYTLTLRVLDTHIRSVEPTLGGWAICLMCYTPFSEALGHYTAHDQDNLYWGDVFAPSPALYVLWGSAILALIFIYVWATASFGLRFSNLTNRGIITSGPYRWVKHPAYLAKNLSWWLISVPFVAGAGWLVALQSCLLLGLSNLIYYARARTEERHLMADPAYREYVAFIARDGLFARLSRLLPLRLRAAA